MKVINLKDYKKVPISFLLTMTICAFALPALAHKVNIFAYVEGGNIYTECYFPDGKPVQNGRIEILNSEGIKVLEGATDSEGKFSASTPLEGDLKIVVHASMGHKSFFLLKNSQAGE
jgi:nickel transport protein